MKKIIGLFLIAGMSFFAACGPSAEEEAAKTEATLDSISQAEDAELARVAAEAQAELDAQAAEDTATAEEVVE